jgi:hypothetical protein
MVGTQTPNHHGSHRGLIWPADKSAPWAKVDAIFVPTAREVGDLAEAVRAARALGCPLVTLHSRDKTTASAADEAYGGSLDLIAIDVPEPARLRLPDLATSRLLAGTVFERRTDTSTKRNVALLLSHMLRWRRVVFLDDDIKVPDPADLNRAAGLLDTHTAAGLRIGGFPDNSVVCHAFREVGGLQDTFIGGGALAVDVKLNRSFFPNIYNEDWFFILDAGKRLQSVATVGEAFQDSYDPYSPERARAQEFGDVLAEGTFWLLDQERSASDGDLAHWQDFLTRRKGFIRQVLRMVERATEIEPAERAKRGEALNAALGLVARITPALCMAYHEALAVDQERWQRHIQAIRQQPKLRREAALESLARPGARPLTWYTRNATSQERRRTAPRIRPVQARELQVAIPPPPAQVPRVVTVYRRARPLLSACGGRSVTCGACAGSGGGHSGRPAGPGRGRRSRRRGPISAASCVTTPESFGVKKQFRASSRPYGAGAYLPRDGHGPRLGLWVLLLARAVVARH